MTDAFLSYHRPDSPHALALSEELQRAGVSVWIDQRDLPVSIPWLEEIEVAIRASRLVVIIDTPGWRDSENCLAEGELATRWVVPILQISPEVPTHRSATMIADRLRSLSGPELVLTDARTLTGEWLEAGRPASRLARGRGLTAMIRAAEEHPDQIPQATWEFLGSSGRLQRRRRLLATGAFILTSLLVSTAFATDSAFRQADEKIDEAVAGFAESSRYTSAAEAGPYPVLELFVADPAPGLAGRFHAASAVSATFPTDARPAGGAATGRSTVDSPDGLLRASIGPGARITVADVRSGEVLSAPEVSAVPAALAWSPDSTHVAAAVADTVETVPTPWSSPPKQYSGATGRVLAVEWENGVIRAVTDAGLEVDWPAETDAIASMPAPGRWFVATEPLGDDTVAVLERGGDLLVVDTRRRHPIRTIPTGVAGATGLSVHPSSREAVVIGDSSVVVDLDSGRTVPLAPPDCEVTAADHTGREGELVVGCTAFTVVALRDGRVTRTIELTATPLSLAASGATVVTGDELGVAHVVDIDSGDIGFGQGACGQVAYATALSKDASHAYVGGSASGLPGCGAVLAIGEETALHRTLFLGLPRPDNRAIALSDDDSLMAWGLSDGSVWVHGARTLDPVQLFRPFQSEVRGIAFTSSGLVAVSRHGHAVHMTLDRDRGSDDELRDRARERLDAAIRMGVR